MLNNTFKTVYLILFLTGSVIRAIGVHKSTNWWRRKENIVLRRGVRLEKFLLFLVFLGMQALPLVYALTPWLDFMDYNLCALASQIAGWSGAAVFVTALWLLWRSHADLKSNFAPDLKIKEGHSLVTQGIFRLIRHPMYAAHWLWAIAQALLLQNWIAGLAFLVFFLPLYLLRVPVEEKMMLEHFGEDYQTYMSRTGRLIPRF